MVQLDAALPFRSMFIEIADMGFNKWVQTQFGTEDEEKNVVISADLSQFFG